MKGLTKQKTEIKRFSRYYDIKAYVTFKHKKDKLR